MRFTLRYTGIRVRDMDKAIQFYTKVLGMKLLGRFESKANKGEFAEVVSKGTKHPLELNWYADDSPVAGRYRKGDELDHLAFEVDDLDETLSYLAKKGYPTVMGPIASKSGRWAYVKDPDGVWIEPFEIKKKEKWIFL